MLLTISSGLVSLLLTRDIRTLRSTFVRLSIGILSLKHYSPLAFRRLNALDAGLPNSAGAWESGAFPLAFMKKTPDPPDPSLVRYLCAALGSGRFLNLFRHPARFAARVLLPAALVIEQHGVARGGRLRRPAGQTRNIGVSGAGEGHPGGAHRSRERNSRGIFEMSGPATAILRNTKEIRWCEARIWQPPSGASQSKRYKYAGAAAWAAFRLASSRE